MIKNNLQKYRNYYDFTQTQLAKQLKISVYLIRKIEFNYYPRYPIRSRICEFFNISSYQMFYIEED